MSEDSFDCDLVEVLLSFGMSDVWLVACSVDIGSSIVRSVDAVFNVVVVFSFSKS